MGKEIRKKAEKYQLRPILQAIFMFTWVTLLKDSASYQMVYILSMAAGMFCLCDNYRSQPRISKGTKFWIVLLSAGFTLSVLLANYSLCSSVYSNPKTTLANIFCGVMGGYFVAYHILVCMVHRLPLSLGDQQGERKKPVPVFLAAMGIIAAVDLMFLFFYAYPGWATIDSINTMQQIIEGSYHNTMPFWHTMTVELFYHIGMAVFHDVNSAMALFLVFQILFMAAGFAYAVTTMYQIGIPRKLVFASFLIYALAIYNVEYSVTHWKDVLFGGAALVLVTALYRILKQVGKNQKLNYVNFAIGALGLSLWRTNGLAVFAITTVLLFFLVRKHFKKLVWLACGITLFSWLLTNPLLSALNVEGTDMVEALSIPLQQIARVITFDESTFTEEEQYLLEEAFDLDIVKEKYKPYLSNPIKFEALRRENLSFLKENFGRYVKLWIQLGMRYPKQYLKAWVDQTVGFWHGGYEYWIYAEVVVENPYGLVYTEQDNPISTLFSMYKSMCENVVIFRPLVCIGLHVWILACCIFLNLIRKRKEELIVTLPIAIIIVGLWIGTPVHAEFRYAYPLFTTYPLLMGTSFFESGNYNKQSGSEGGA